MLELTEKCGLEIINKLESCEGLWIREEEGKKSVIDHVTVNKEDVDSVESFKIDEEKQYTPYRKTEERKIYTDHNAIIVKINWVVTSINEKQHIYQINEKNSKEICRKTTANSRFREITRGHTTRGGGGGVTRVSEWIRMPPPPGNGFTKSAKPRHWVGFSFKKKIAPALGHVLSSIHFLGRFLTKV